MKDCEVVFLIPGFLGFEHLADYTYFADRVAVALRAALSQRVRADGPELRVLPVPIPPTASFATRQHALAKTLVRRAQAIARSEQLHISGIHLVGHSAGGVDAHLLSLERPLDPETQWHNFDGVDVFWLRERLRSVISIASPHQGTCLSLDPLARMLASGDLMHLLGRVPLALKELLQLVAALPALVADAELPELLAGVLNSPSGHEFIRSLWSSRDLINDLTPAAALERYRRGGRALPILRRSFVTVAGLTVSSRQSALGSLRHGPSARQRHSDAAPLSANAPTAGPDALFLFLSTLTSGRGSGALDSQTLAPFLPGSAQRITDALRDPQRVITANPELVPQYVDGALNDGVVNSARQLIDPSDPNELAAVVVADHFDVIGHYDRSFWVTDARTGHEHAQTIVSGLLHSGSEFRDSQFFALIDRLCAELAPLL
ncbi:MAG: hypothetical protein RL701_290 [Pseudomonadota bacterium]